MSVTKRYKQLKEVLDEAGVSSQKIAAMDGVLKNSATIGEVLEKLRKQIEKEDIIIPYDNGGGQTGVRENPIVKSYESLWRSYMLGMNKIIEAIGEDNAAAVAPPETTSSVLELIQAKRSKIG